MFSVYLVASECKIAINIAETNAENGEMQTETTRECPFMLYLNIQKLLIHICLFSHPHKLELTRTDELTTESSKKWSALCGSACYRWHERNITDTQTRCAITALRRSVRVARAARDMRDARRDSMSACRAHDRARSRAILTCGVVVFRVNSIGVSVYSVLKIKSFTLADGRHPKALFALLQIKL